MTPGRYTFYSNQPGSTPILYNCEIHFVDTPGAGIDHLCRRRILQLRAVGIIIAHGSDYSPITTGSLAAHGRSTAIRQIARQKRRRRTTLHRSKNSRRTPFPRDGRLMPSSYSRGGALQTPPKCFIMFNCAGCWKGEHRNGIWGRKAAFRWQCPHLGVAANHVVAEKRPFTYNSHWCLPALYAGAEKRIWKKY